MLLTNEVEVPVTKERRSSRDGPRYRHVIAWPKDVDGGYVLDEVILRQPSLRMKPYDAYADLAITFSTKDYRLRFSVTPTTSHAPQTWSGRHQFARCLGIALYEKFDELLSDVTWTARRHLINPAPLTAGTAVSVALAGLPPASREPAWLRWIPEATADVDTYERAATMNVPVEHTYTGTPASRVSNLTAYFEKLKPTIALLRYMNIKAESVQTAR